MRSLLSILLALVVALLAVLCTLALEPARWCVLSLRPWWRRPRRLDRDLAPRAGHLA
jgi:hypothetical protein